MKKLLIGIAEKKPIKTVQKINFICEFERGSSNGIFLGYDTQTQLPVAIRKVNDETSKNISIIKNNDPNDEYGCSKPYKIIKKWIIMPLHGYSLTKRIIEVGPLNEKELLLFTVRVASTLSWLEKTCNFSHCDISPNNFVFDSLKDYPNNVSTIRLIDFDTLKQSTTIGKGFVGTIIYASPEHNAGKRFQYRANDAYALGMVIYYCATGNINYFHHTKKPYSESISKIIDSLTNTNPYKRAKYDNIVKYASSLLKS
jgi:serine/threonine protein kinase